jgi:hypothetical protein
MHVFLAAGGVAGHNRLVTDLPGQMRILVKCLQRKPMFVDVTEFMTVSQLKQSIASATGMHALEMRIVFRGSVLPDTVRVLLLNLTSKSSIWFSPEPWALSRIKTIGCPYRPYLYRSTADCPSVIPPSRFSSLSASPSREQVPGQIAAPVDYTPMSEAPKVMAPPWLGDSDYIERALAFQYDPVARFEMQKSMDRSLILAESRIGGFSKLTSRHVNGEDILHKYASARADLNNAFPTVIPQSKLSAPSISPLPCQFSQPRPLADAANSPTVQQEAPNPTGPLQEFLAVEKRNSRTDLDEWFLYRRARRKRKLGFWLGEVTPEEKAAYERLEGSEKVKGARRSPMVSRLRRG